MGSELSRRPLSALPAALASGLLLAAGCALLEPRDRRVEEWTRQVEVLRELRFTEAVRFKWLTRDELRPVVRRELDEANDPELVALYAEAWAALGLLPAGVDFYALLVRLHEEQLAGMYSPRQRTMFALADDPDVPVSEEVVAVHELVHALQHQHFPQTFELLDALSHNDDLVTALRSVVEGDAVLTMLGVPTASGLSRDLPSAVRMSEVVRAEQLSPRGVLADYPLLLRAWLTFPYAEGVVFAARRYERGGNRALDASLEAPPLSTRQILDDDRDPVEMIELPLDALEERLAGRGCTLGHDNVAGALGLEVLFTQFRPEVEIDRLVRSWSGDRFAQARCGESWELLWLTRWATSEAARRFADQYAAIAPFVASVAPLSSIPSVRVEGRTALVLTDGLLPDAELLLAGSSIRAYSSLAEWLAGGCFSESECPAGVD